MTERHLWIALEETRLDAAMSAIVYSVTLGVSTLERAVCGRLSIYPIIR